MPDPRRTSVSSRKQPKQSRSTELVRAILEAAIHVLKEEGAPRFTTARVAERAGVSVGSLYQYFPNKAAILFRLQTEEWRETTTLLQGILNEAGVPPELRLRRLVHAFIRSECDEAAMRGALDDAAPLYRDSPEAVAAKAPGELILEPFLETYLSDVDAEGRKLAADLIVSALSNVGKSFSERPRGTVAIARFSDALADMICAYLSHVRGASTIGASRPRR